MRIILNNKDNLYKWIFRILWFFICIFGAYENLISGEGGAINYSTTSYAFSYLKYGFNSRMFLGTIYQLIGLIFPSIISWKGCYCFMLIILALFDLSFLLFVEYIINKTCLSNRINIYCVSLLTMLIMILSYSYGSNFGKPDTFLFMLSFIQIYLIVEEKHEFLVPLLSILQVMTHEGFLCMIANVSICLLAYKALTKKTKEEKRKYWILFAVNMICICSFAIYFVFFKISGNAKLYEQAVKDSALLNRVGSVHYEYVAQRINYLESVPSAGTSYFKNKEISQTPIFLILFSPVLIFYLFNLFRTVKNNEHSIGTLVIYAIGIILIIPEFILFCDYPRYFTWIIFFTFVYVGILSLNSTLESKRNVSKATTIMIVLIIIYSLLFIPLESSNYPDIVNKLYNLITNNKI